MAADELHIDENNLRTGTVVRFDRQYGCGFLKADRIENPVCFLWEDGRMLSTTTKVDWSSLPPGGKISPPKLGDILVFTLVTTPLPRAGCWTYASFYEATKKQLAQRLQTRPVYRLVKLTYSTVSANYGAEVIWTGQNLADPKLVQAVAQYHQLAPEANCSSILHFEIWRPNGHWQACPDPRPSY